LESQGANFMFNTEFKEIAPGMYLTGEVPRKTDFEIGDLDQVINSGDDFIKDPMRDDQSLIIKTEKGLFVILAAPMRGSSISWIMPGK